MDKNAIKKYAVWARKQLIEKVTARAIKYQVIDGQELDYTLENINGVLLSENERKQRNALIQKIKIEGYDQVMEEVAYTWFNRFVAIRFMEVNGYLPSHIRVFSDENGAFKPQILTEAIHLDLPGLDIDKVIRYKEDANEEELFKYLLKVQCNALNEILPRMFQKIEDYTELLLPDFLLREGSVVDRLVKEIDQDNFDIHSENGQVEIIGWLYQYYNDERKNAVINVYKGCVKKEDIPAATQLFTTDWVVRYIVDNSIGRYWIERHPDSQLKEDLEYLIIPNNGTFQTVDEEVTPQELTVFDPAMGSAHFLVYAFEVLMKIYKEYGYSEVEAASLIVEHNLYGLDIDERASQLAYFAVMMKAREYDRRFFSRSIQPNVYPIEESAKISNIAFFDYFEEDRNNAIDLYNTFKIGKECGSILRLNLTLEEVEKIDKHLKRMDDISNYKTLDVMVAVKEIAEIMRPLVLQAKILLNKYSVVATNPPYLNKLEGNLKQYVLENYKDYGGDLFSIFMYHNMEFCRKDGYVGFMTPFVWMFIKTYEKLRDYIIDNKQIVSLIQMEYSAFEEATVPICSFVICNNKKEEPGLFIKLSDFRGGMNVQRQKVLEALGNRECGYYYETKQNLFKKINSSPIAYWLSEGVFKTFDLPTVSRYISPRIGLVTGDADRFLRLWFEVGYQKIKWDCLSVEDNVSSGYKWFPYQKGGAFRKWYGNNEYVINWENDGWECKNDNYSGKRVKSHNYNGDYAFKPAITWTKISSGSFACRYVPEGFMFDDAGPICSVSKKDVYLFLALLNSNVGQFYLSVLSPTMNFLPGHINAIPVDYSKLSKDINCVRLAEETVDYEKQDWDAFEVSWEFEEHPFIRWSKELWDLTAIDADMHYYYGENFKVNCPLELCFMLWQGECNDRFKRLKLYEEELNRIFIEIYGLQDELTPEVEDKDVTVRLADLQRDIRSFISYAVGCMLGRYSINIPGLAYAGGDWDASKYKTFQADEDAIIPICDDEYFEDDIVGRFVKFVETVYGKDTLEDNLKFIADALGGNGTSREVIRNYFINDFYADHVKIYQKRPIYWLFDSGKKNGFKCLIYMHRYHPDTIARIRTDYVHEQQARYRTAIEEIEKRIETASQSDKVKLTRKLNSLKDQDEEIHVYEEKIHHLADQMISIDLDDGVKHNYALFQDVLANIK